MLYNICAVTFVSFALFIFDICDFVRRSLEGDLCNWILITFFIFSPICISVMEASNYRNYQTKSKQAGEIGYTFLLCAHPSDLHFPNFFFLSTINMVLIWTSQHTQCICTHNAHYTIHTLNNQNNNYSQRRRKKKRNRIKKKYIYKICACQPEQSGAEYVARCAWTITLAASLYTNLKAPNFFSVDRTRSRTNEMNLALTLHSRKLTEWPIVINHTHQAKCVREFFCFVSCVCVYGVGFVMPVLRPIWTWAYAYLLCALCSATVFHCVRMHRAVFRYIAKIICSDEQDGREESTNTHENKRKRVNIEHFRTLNALLCI